MVVDLKWRDAMAVAGGAFTAEERQSGWPLCMTPAQLGRLQRPWVKGDATAQNRHKSLVQAIQAACKAGDLAHELREVTLQKCETRPANVIRRTWEGRVFAPGTKQVQVPVQVRVPYVSAAAFAQWLHAQGEEPSAHVAHWFKLRGVSAGAQALAQVPSPEATTPAPAIEPEEGWVSTWNGRALRFKAGPAGRLVRLVEVVKWLMRPPHELPLAEAVRQVISKVEQAGSGVVAYGLDQVDFARPMPSEWDAAACYFHDDEYLKKFTPAVASVHGLQSWLMDPRELSRGVNASGFPTVYDLGTETPFEFYEREQRGASLLAVDFATAHRLWGWGRPAGHVAEKGEPEASAVATASNAPADDPEDEILKRGDLIDALRPRWSSIENDLSEASRNGLKEVAHAGHGRYRKNAAVAWAKSRGKYKEAPPSNLGSSIFPSLVHRM